MISTITSLDCLDGMTCDEGETCCYDDSGRSGCCGYDSAVCCDDHVHCCPQATTCDLASKSCKRSSDFLTFEFLPMIEKKQSRSTVPVTVLLSLAVQPEQYIDLFNGFLEGSGLGPYFPDLTDCTANSTAIITSIKQAVNDFTKVNATFLDIADGIQMIGIAIQGIANVTTSCKKLPESLSVAINYVLKIANDPAKWFNLVSASATKNSIWIMMNLYTLTDLVKTDKFKDMGTKLGEIVKYIFQVDLDSFMLLAMPEGIKGTGDVAKCIASIVNNAQKMGPIIQDVISHPENMAADFLQVLAIVNDLKASCAGVLPFSTALVAFPQKKKLTKVPSIAAILDCVKAIKPFAGDIYNAVTSYAQGDTEKALNYLTAAGIDAIGLGATCYKVIQEILEN